jgi:hypothetical protein
VENGFLFMVVSDGFVTGSTEPDWSIVQPTGNIYDGVNGAWQNVGPISTWVSQTHYVLLGAGTRFVLPTTPNGHVYAMQARSDAAAYSGDIEPAFLTTAEGFNTVDDNNLQWSVTTTFSLALQPGDADGVIAWLLLPSSGPDMRSVSINGLAVSHTTLAQIFCGQCQCFIYRRDDGLWYGQSSL